MILGYVLDKIPRVKLTLRGRSSPITVNFIVGTGFEGAIALPNTLLNRLNATYVEGATIETATGIFSEEAVYAATVVWDDRERTVEIGR